MATVTIKDVAKRAGVSVGTVSRVLNKAKNINQQNIDKVNAAVKELGYRKCNAAQLLVSKKNSSRVRTGNIGVIFSELTSSWRSRPHLAYYIQAIEQACREKGYHSIIEWADDTKDAETPACVREGKVDGVIVKSKTIDCSKYGELPVVGLSSCNSPVVHVAPDNRLAGWSVAEYLWNKGHRKMAFISNIINHPMFIARYNGYREFLEQKNSFYLDLVQIYDGLISQDKPEETFPDLTDPVHKLLKLSEEEQPTAIITANDWIAAGLYNALRQFDISIPQQISVVGFDNLETLCCSLFPAMTSYAIPFEKTAYVAAKKLLDIIEHPLDEKLASLELIQGELVERQSVAELNDNV